MYAVNLRWPDRKIICPRCGKAKHSFIKTRLLWLCKGCKKQFTVKVGTIFEDSALGLDKWMTALDVGKLQERNQFARTRTRALGITQKSAWFMLQRIRVALKKKALESRRRLGSKGSETFIGGEDGTCTRAPFETVALRRAVGKALVMGILTAAAMSAPELCLPPRTTCQCADRSRMAPRATPTKRLLL